MILKIYLENIKAPHNKFYEITILNNNNTYQLMSRYGKIGIAGIESISYIGNNLEDVKDKAISLRDAKIKKGYILVTSSIIDNKLETTLDYALEKQLINSLKIKKKNELSKIEILERKFAIYPEGRLSLILNG